MGSYLRPASLEGALDALASGRRVLLAGGTDIYPARVGRPVDDDILDISALPDARQITFEASRYRIPALATWTDVVRHDLPARFDGLKRAAGAIGGVQIQNRGTVCGNLCNASPAADGLPNLMALEASVELWSASGRRELPVGEFVTGNRRTARRDDELVTAVFVPAPGVDRARSTFLKLGSRAYLVISIAMIAAVVDLGADGRVSGARVVVGACSEVPQRLPSVEARLLDRRSSELAAVDVGPADLAGLSPIDDIRGTAAYRRAAALTLVRRALADLAGSPA